ncbi:MAG: nucleotidyl transferase AbiEii/AbiGii toxin family protein [Elusimicrobia bacterium]|nr:nucleotidyl transferase AbiEii/AbiGii toxin family protein [Elusimicrobiota bacterium]
MALRNEPSIELAERVLPPPLLAALRHIFGQGLAGCGLVGGTALAGFYAGHRRSDDLDLFTDGEANQKAVVLAVRSLESLGAEVQAKTTSASYFRALCLLNGHRFNVDVCVSELLFRVGGFVTLGGGMAVADLDTMLMLKAAALASRCAEKDLYDLIWILERCPGMTLKGFVEAGQRYDAGADAEGLLIGVLGSHIEKESCGFSLDPALSKEAVFRQVSKFKKELSQALRTLAKGQEPPPLAGLVAKARAFSRGGGKGYHS